MAQNGKISGRVIDSKTGEELIGASIYLKNTQPRQGASADIDGRFLIDAVKPGPYILVVSYIAYKTKELNITVQAGQTLTLNLGLEDAEQELGEVIIKGEVRKESVNAFLIEQKKSNIIGNGITADAIKRSPDNNSGEALKRVSGATLQGGKFAIVRGLNERYNLAMINNSPLPSTEPEKRAFALDLFPANMLDQLVIVKSASPEQPGDWSGGIILVRTKDVPDNKFFNVSLGGGVNSLTTFNAFTRGQSQDGDLFGLGAKARQLPEDFTSGQDIRTLKSLGTNEARSQLSELGRRLPNSYALENISSALPNGSLNVSGGTNIKLTENSKLGVIFSGLYSNSRSFRTIQRNWWRTDGGLAQTFVDSTYESDVRAGGMLNLQYKLASHTKITFKNTYNHNGEDLFTKRQGERIGDNFIQSYSYQYTFNQMLYSQLGGEHVINLKSEIPGSIFDFSKMRVSWETGFGRTQRQLPDYRNVEYVKQSQDDNYTLRLLVQNGSEDVARLFTKLNEEIKSASANVELPYAFGNLVKGNIKTGYFHQFKQRFFDARFISTARPSTRFDFNLLELPVEQIFDASSFYYNDANTGRHGFLLDDITRPYHTYYANAALHAGYVSIETNVMARHKVIYGVRIESYRQVLNSADANSNPVNIDTTWNSFLPSVNYVYNLNDKSNLRASYFRSLSRPEFRELAPFAFLDFQTFSILTGNANLQVTRVHNAEVRWEIFPDAGEVFSVSAFYKQFENPIELLLDNSITLGAIGRIYRNLPSAQSYGIELDARKNLKFMDKWFGTTDVMSSFTAYGNFSYIFSQINLGNETNTWSSERPMQGQSPYIINLGMQWESKKHHWVATVLFNRYGERIYNVGTATLPDIFEKARSVIDFQLSKKFLKERLEVKASVNDLLRQDLLFFFDYDRDTKFNKNTDVDREVFRYQMPRMIGFGASLKF